MNPQRTSDPLYLEKSQERTRRDGTTSIVGLPSFSPTLRRKERELARLDERIANATIRRSGSEFTVLNPHVNSLSSLPDDEKNDKGNVCSSLEECCHGYNIRAEIKDQTGIDYVTPNTSNYRNGYERNQRIALNNRKVDIADQCTYTKNDVKHVVDVAKRCRQREHHSTSIVENYGRSESDICRSSTEGMSLKTLIQAKIQMNKKIQNQTTKCEEVHSSSKSNLGRTSTEKMDLEQQIQAKVEMNKKIQNRTTKCEEVNSSSKSVVCRSNTEEIDLEQLIQSKNKKATQCEVIHNSNVSDVCRSIRKGMSLEQLIQAKIEMNKKSPNLEAKWGSENDIESVGQESNKPKSPRFETRSNLERLIQQKNDTNLNVIRTGQHDEDNLNNNNSQMLRLRTQSKARNNEQIKHDQITNHSGSSTGVSNFENLIKLKIQMNQATKGPIDFNENIIKPQHSQLSLNSNTPRKARDLPDASVTNHEVTYSTTVGQRLDDLIHMKVEMNKSNVLRSHKRCEYPDLIPMDSVGTSITLGNCNSSISQPTQSMESRFSESLVSIPASSRRVRNFNDLVASSQSSEIIQSSDPREIHLELFASSQQRRPSTVSTSDRSGDISVDSYSHCTNTTDESISSMIDISIMHATGVLPDNLLRQIESGSIIQYQSHSHDHQKANEKKLVVAVPILDDHEIIAKAIFYEQSRSSILESSKRRRRLLHIFVGFVTILIFMAVGVVWSFVKLKKQEKQNIDTRENMGMQEFVAEHLNFNVTELLYNKSEELFSFSHANNNPYSKALQWIIMDDPMQLVPKLSPNFLQRYALAYFYFSTTMIKKPVSASGSDKVHYTYHYREWTSCSPLTQNLTSLSVEKSSVNNHPFLPFETCAPNSDFLRSTLSDDDLSITYKTNSERWLSDAPECDWLGVKCDRMGQVVTIRLAHNGLSGIIPEGLRHLPFLRGLTISYGNIEGKLPSDIFSYHYKHVYQLEIQGNQITGPFPEDFIKSRNLNSVRLFSNKLNGTIPLNINEWKDLKQLVVSDNNLSGSLPKSIGAAANLALLVLNDNELEGSIPSEIGHIRTLRKISIANNTFTGYIPSDIGQLSGTDYLDLGNNNLTGSIPTELYSLTNLVRLDLQGNHLNGTISKRIGTLSNLKWLMMGNNQFSGTLPSELGLIPEMIDVLLYDNNLRGVIPAELCAAKPTRIEADCLQVRENEVKLSCPTNCCTLCCNSSECRRIHN